MLLYHSNPNYTFYGKDNGCALFRKRHKKGCLLSILFTNDIYGSRNLGHSNNYRLTCK